MQFELITEPKSLLTVNNPILYLESVKYSEQTAKISLVYS